MANMPSSCHPSSSASACGNTYFFEKLGNTSARRGLLRKSNICKYKSALSEPLVRQPPPLPSRPNMGRAITPAVLGPNKWADRQPGSRGAGEQEGPIGLKPVLKPGFIGLSSIFPRTGSSICIGTKGSKSDVPISVISGIFQGLGEAGTGHQGRPVQDRHLSASTPSGREPQPSSSEATGGKPFFNLFNYNTTLLSTYHHRTYSTVVEGKLTTSAPIVERSATNQSEACSTVCRGCVIGLRTTCILHCL